MTQDEIRQEANYHLHLSFWWHDKYQQNEGKLSDTLLGYFWQHAEEHSQLAVHFYSKLNAN
ncbi:MAG: hypothetical protein GTO60_16470 [Gammaproteobacteria bacterium]|nr:hypothetical protein [Gammaproteobacteria bacterium]